MFQPENKNRKILLGKIWRLKHISLLVEAELNRREPNLKKHDRNSSILLDSKTFGILLLVQVILFFQFDNFKFWFIFLFFKFIIIK